MAGIGIVINPHSKKHRRQPEKVKKLGYILGDKGSCESTKDLNDISRVAEEFKEREIDILCISGGDGTNHCTLTSFIDVYGDTPFPKITFLRGGTMNTIAAAMRIKGSPEDILSNIVEKYHFNESFEILERPVLKVNNKYGFIFGTGFINNFLDLYYHNGIPGPKKALKLMANTIGSTVINGDLSKKLFEPYKCRIIADGEIHPFNEVVGLASSTIKYIGFGFNPFYRAYESLNKFQLLGFNTSARQFIRLLPTMFAGKPNLFKNDNFDLLSKEISLESDEPIPYQIDGDIQKPTTKIDLSLGPRLKIIIK